MTRLAAITACTGLALAFSCASSDADAPAKIPATQNGPREVAMVGAGCFWGVEKWMGLAPGIVSTEVGYAGGKNAHVGYEDVSNGNTGHAETVKIVFDPSVVSYEDLLASYFFKMHDPTQLNGQGNDRGTQYRSVIFPQSDAQRATAEKVKARVEKSGAWKKPVTTTIESGAIFVPAEDYHQHYLVKHPGGYDNHYMRDLKF